MSGGWTQVPPLHVFWVRGYAILDGIPAHVTELGGVWAHGRRSGSRDTIGEARPSAGASAAGMSASSAAAAAPEDRAHSSGKAKIVLTTGKSKKKPESSLANRKLSSLPALRNQTGSACVSHLLPPPPQDVDDEDNSTTQFGEATCRRQGL